MVHVIPGLARSTGGPAVMVVELSGALGRLGVESAIFSTDLSGPAGARNRRRARESDLPARARDVDVRLFPARQPYRLAFSPALYSALAHETLLYDVVHIHSLYLFPQFAAFRQAKRHDVPYVLSQHGTLDPHLRGRGRFRKRVVDLLWQNRMLEGAAALHVGTEEEARVIADIAPRVRRLTAPFGIRWDDYEELTDDGKFRRLYLDGFEGPIVMNVGRLARKKGLDVLIRAFAIGASKASGARLVLVGPDDEGLRPSLVELAQREGIAERVTFTGILQGEDLRAALAAAHVWVLPSKAEAFPMAVMEALAAGKPVVISPWVNTASDISAAGAGIVCEPEPEALASEIALLLSDEKRRAELQRKARAFVSSSSGMGAIPRRSNGRSRISPLRTGGCCISTQMRRLRQPWRPRSSG